VGDIIEPNINNLLG